MDDLRVWINDASDIYLASLAYLKLFAEEPKMRGLSRQQLQNLSKVWMSSAPTKVVSFSWKILLEKAHIRLKLFPLSGYSWCGDSYLLVVWIHLGFGMKFIFHHWCGDSYLLVFLYMCGPLWRFSPRCGFLVSSSLCSFMFIVELILVAWELFYFFGFYFFFYLFCTFHNGFEYPYTHVFFIDLFF